MTRDWALITVTYNSAETLKHFWKGFNPGGSVEWIVVDNNSADDSVEVAKSLGARVVALGVNMGFGAANNVGLTHSSSRFVAFVNPDVTVTNSGLDRLREALEDRPMALVAPQLVNPDGSLQPNGRGMPYLANKILNRVAPHRVAEFYHRYANSGDQTHVDWLMGAVVAGSREWITTIGGWDERFFVYYEDSDLGLRNAKRGGASLVLGDVQWLHGWARETKTASLRAWKLEIPSMAKFYARYPKLLLPPRHLVRKARK